LSPSSAINLMACSRAESLTFIIFTMLFTHCKDKYFI
jgi:hypothetical protein